MRPVEAGRIAVRVLVDDRGGGVHERHSTSVTDRVALELGTLFLVCDHQTFHRLLVLPIERDMQIMAAAELRWSLD